MKSENKNLFTLLPKPAPYEASTSPFWDDAYISIGLLDAHLNPNHDAATRSLTFVEASATWIRSLVKDLDHPKLLDLGCGPGIYATYFHQQGFRVVGLDFSKRSIAYAKEQAEKKELNIVYRYQNYLDLDEKEAYDVITLIYCDYAVLSQENRLHLLKKIKQSLKPKGLFIFDVFTHQQYENEKESSTWYFSEQPGFWRNEPHMCLERHLIYEGHLHLDEYIVMDEKDNIESYRIWDQSFDEDSIKKELNAAGFNQISVYSDVCGNIYHPNSKTMGIVVSHG
ncbi:MAG: hypothetical protein A2Y45_06380 [Tenericutes bacterium GWC2_34_14]|nr:MAG: hypothetical protein A2Z84_00770 [Tenericutes bacterium GWA2_35_7]OHE28581.1 MAG: hypothetical protein A2Y45_06380 [Tenericutes bacterium GWC2_34_14]OHE33511.1 MAG: hypothetical protein A2012_03430 [Tenericutes bacterium GWE2_34_108]OHE36796.1 MAG: hypothetical protein A2Y46_09230 [Tenericutes bacterium GWF1_35_14]OHE38124.1 MAG: hypothetical protein A2Y44_09435 [Tenericutes bacterium GWF2_35_184]OHE42146.1 MAG: hypothetical protein A3K26_07095 [Tenericutes bacterium RIFOXYA12_FULL_35_